MLTGKKEALGNTGAVDIDTSPAAFSLEPSSLRVPAWLLMKLHRDWFLVHGPRVRIVRSLPLGVGSRPPRQ